MRRLIAPVLLVLAGVFPVQPQRAYSHMEFVPESPYVPAAPTWTPSIPPAKA